MNEADFRKQVDATFQRIEAALEAMDPDIIECERGGGGLTLRFAGGQQFILSPQTPLRQLWLAMAGRTNEARRFSFDETKQCWVDERHHEELLGFLNAHLRDLTHLDIVIR